MLALMSVLEADGPAFTQKMAITLTSGQDRGLVYQVNNTNSLLHVIKYASNSKAKSLVHKYQQGRVSQALCGCKHGCSAPRGGVQRTR